MTDTGAISSGTIQVGDVQRPLAAVSKISEAGNMTFSSEGEDWIIDRKDPIAQEIIRLVQKATMKTKVHEHKGTYRMRAWLIPESGADEPTNPFGRQGA